MKDALRDYLKKHEPKVPPAPADEWSRILEKTRTPRRIWVYLSAATLSAAGLMAFVNLEMLPDAEARLEVEDVLYREDVADRGAYGDWLWLTDSVDAEGED